MNIRALAGKIGLDYEKTIEDFCGDVSALGAKLKGFSSACNIDELKSALSENNTAAIKKAAHAIRKASEKVGITSLAKAASRVEEAEDAKIASACQTLIEKYSEVIAFIAENEA